MTHNYRESLDRFQLIRACLIFLAVVSLSTASRSARAAVIEVTAVDGETMAQADAFTSLPAGDEGDGDSESDSASSFADFPLDVDAFAVTSEADASAGASLIASMMGNLISAEGSAEAFATAGEMSSANAGGSADISITFSLAEPLGYRLFWGFGIGGFGIGPAFISLRSSDAEIFSNSSGIGSGVEMGVLEAGEYVLSGGAGATARVDFLSGGGVMAQSSMFGFRFSVVPEPGSAALVAMAAMTLSACLLRKRRRSLKSCTR